MKKEAAKKAFDFLIDNIYEDFESRSCITCKHFKDYLCVYHDFVPVHTFGQASDRTFCHKWEKDSD